MTLYIILALIITGTILLYFSTGRMAQFGASPKGARLERILKSPNYDGTAFVNKHNVTLSFSMSDYGSMLKHMIFGDEQRTPEITIPVHNLTRSDFDGDTNEDLHFTWLGHSTVLLEIDGKTILTDPVFSKRTSPVSFIGPSRFHPVPLAIEALPPLDVVIISHDHYDHLDMKTVKKLAESGVTFVTALGVGAHLESWDIDAKQIVELDWWDEYKISDSFTLACCPSQHFSGRSWFSKNNQTLWSTWSIIGSKRRVFFCGDTGEIPEFDSIGQKYGPFDLTLMKIGAYNSEYWPTIHLTPEQSARLHQKLQGKVMMPIHWGTFNLALHSWNEPINRLIDAAQKENINLVTPIPGQRININSLPQPERWWDNKTKP